MSDYTPTTEEVRASYLSALTHNHPMNVGEVIAEFNHWLAEVKAEAWEEGHEAAAMRVPEGVWHDTASPRTPNPYREEANNE